MKLLFVVLTLCQLFTVILNHKVFSNNNFISMKNHKNILNSRNLSKKLKLKNILKNFIQNENLKSINFKLNL
jgi:hypothetical protein